MNRTTLQRRPAPCAAPFPAWPLATFLLAASAAPAVQATDFATRDQYAWSENAGWLNLKATNDNAQVYSDHLEGYAWHENLRDTSGSDPIFPMFHR
jgi:hypothetical protein